MLIVFFITTADSASMVNSQLTQRGNPAVTNFWVICMAGIALTTKPVSTSTMTPRRKMASHW